MADAVSSSGNLNNQMKIADFFDGQYQSEPRYWWRDKERYAPDADSYPFSLVTQMTLRLIGRPPGGCWTLVPVRELIQSGWRYSAMTFSQWR